MSGMRIHGAAAPPRGPSPSGQPSAVDLLSHPALGQEGHLVLGHSGGLLTYFAPRRAIFRMVLFLASFLESMCDEWFLFSQSHSCIELFAASHLDVECLKLLAPLFDV